MMEASTTNKRTRVRFGGPEDSSNRSAWQSTMRSFKPPSCVERKPTIGMDTIDKAKADAALVAALDAEANYDGKDNAMPLMIAKPSVLKHRSKTVPTILKTTKGPSRSAWSNDEISIMAPCPAQRQKTLEESELRALCTSVAAMGVTVNASTEESSTRRYRGSSPRTSPSNSASERDW
eukprot:CAMPEP_0197284708 /NCGR_PEP_ID=MMETSP1432-20130617/25582_1 /TAXON_ID=44447 /ORGANISM="Pseudo-nitzschia delicatissima, Strain UNC1205" /LENGTH=177 /DNA_ID=CAMNT_0042751723 /DNA_START=21 /DNA_END=554 /DNA_ORIENTATION=-